MPSTAVRSVGVLLDQPPINTPPVITGALLLQFCMALPLPPPYGAARFCTCYFHRGKARQHCRSRDSDKTSKSAMGRCGQRVQLLSWHMRSPQASRRRGRWRSCPRWHTMPCRSSPSHYMCLRRSSGPWPMPASWPSRTAARPAAPMTSSCKVLIFLVMQSSSPSLEHCKDTLLDPAKACLPWQNLVDCLW